MPGTTQPICYVFLLLLNLVWHPTVENHGLCTVRVYFLAYTSHDWLGLPLFTSYIYSFHPKPKA